MNGFLILNCFELTLLGLGFLMVNVIVSIARNEPSVAVSANDFTTPPLFSIVIAALYSSILTRAEAQC